MKRIKADALTLCCRNCAVFSWPGEWWWIGRLGTWCNKCWDSDWEAQK